MENQEDMASAASSTGPSQAEPEVSALRASVPDAWPVWEVGVYGFGDFYVEAPTKASARWWVATAYHDAGYGRSPVELIQRGVTVRMVDRTFAGIMGDIHRVKLRRPRHA